RRPPRPSPRPNRPPAPRPRTGRSSEPEARPDRRSRRRDAAMAPPTRIVMLGTRDFAVPTFEHLGETGHNVGALVAQPDRPQGRRQELIPSPIRLAAEARGVPVLQPDDVNAPDAIAKLRALGPELLVTAAYGQILSAELLGVPRLGGIN